MTGSRPNSKRDRGAEKLEARLDLIHRQPDAASANATATGFHGANPSQLRRLYIGRYAPEYLDRARLAGGQDLVGVFTAAWDSAHPQARLWTGTDLRCAREALGLSMVQLADWLPWKQSRISEAERGLRRVPTWVAERVVSLERAREALTESMLEHLEGAAGAPLIVHATDAGYAAAHPTDPPIPAAVQRVAAALAASEWGAQTGTRPGIVLAD